MARASSKASSYAGDPTLDAPAARRERVTAWVGRPSRARARVWGLNVLLAAIWLWFARAHLVFWASTGDPRGIGAMAMETIVAMLFLTRRASIEVSREPIAWAATVVGAFGPMLMRPVPGAGGTVGLVLQLAGASFACLSLLYLGRSFGLIAANRGVVVQGPYRLVRHPAYLGYLVVGAGYVIENTSSRNVIIMIVATLGQLARIRYEERVLSYDSTYDAYRRRVRFRLVPYVY